MNLEFILIMVFLITSVFYIFHKIHRFFKEKREESLFRALRTIADSARMGEATESTIKRIADMKKESSSKIFRFVLNKMEQGETFPDSINKAKKKFHSEILYYLSPILKNAQETGIDVYEIMNSYSEKLWKLKYNEKYAKDSIKNGQVTIKMLGVIILPLIFYFFPKIIEQISFDNSLFYFLAGFASLIGLNDLMIYDDWVSSLIKIPLFGSLCYCIPIIIQKLPDLVNFIIYVI